MLFLILSILTLVAWWKIFEKMGEAGWKGFIPVYNIYVLCQRLCRNNNIFFVYAVCFALALFSGSEGFMNALASFGLGITNFLIYHKLSKAFGHGILFTLGLVCLQPFFHYILGFGKSRYFGPQY